MSNRLTFFALLLFLLLNAITPAMAQVEWPHDEVVLSRWHRRASAVPQDKCFLTRPIYIKSENSLFYITKEQTAYFRGVNTMKVRRKKMLLDIPRSEYLTLLAREKEKRLYFASLTLNKEKKIVTVVGAFELPYLRLLYKREFRRKGLCRYRYNKATLLTHKESLIAVLFDGCLVSLSKRDGKTEWFNNPLKRVTRGWLSKSVKQLPSRSIRAKILDGKLFCIDVNVRYGVYLFQLPRDEKYIGACDPRTRISVYDLETGKELFNQGSKFSFANAVQANGIKIIGYPYHRYRRRGGVFVFDYPSLKRRWMLERSYLLIAMNEERGKLLCSRDRNLLEVDIVSGKLKRLFRAEKGNRFLRAIYGKCGKELLVCRFRKMLKLAGSPLKVAWSRDCSSLIFNNHILLDDIIVFYTKEGEFTAFDWHNGSIHPFEPTDPLR